MSNEWELLKKEDEEFQMLREVSDEHARQKKEKTRRQKSGKATEIVIRNHLLEKGFKVTLKPNVKIKGSKIKNDLLLLKPEAKPDEQIYEPDKVDMVIEIKNNVVGGKKRINGTQEDPNEKIRDNFNELEDIAKINRFAVIVLSEKLPSISGRKPYKWGIQEKKIRKKNCRVFTLVARERWDKLYEIDVINKMHENEELRKTGEWEKFIAYLKE